MIRLTGSFDPPADRMQAIIKALPDHIRLTRAEPGCVAFSVTADPKQPGRFQVRELFASQADFDAHQKRTKASPWGRISAGIPRQYTIETITGPDVNQDQRGHE